MNGAVLHPSPGGVLQLERNIFVGVRENVQSGRRWASRLGFRPFHIFGMIGGRSEYAAAGEVPELALLTRFETHDLDLVHI